MANCIPQWYKRYSCMGTARHYAHHFTHARKGQCDSAAEGICISRSRTHTAIPFIPLHGQRCGWITHNFELDRKNKSSMELFPLMMQKMLQIGV